MREKLKQTTLNTYRHHDYHKVKNKKEKRQWMKGPSPDRERDKRASLHHSQRRSIPKIVSLSIIERQHSEVMFIVRG